MSLNFKNIDFRALQRYTSPQAMHDLNHFLEKMPQNSGKAILIVAGVIWGVAGVLGLYTTVQSRSLAELRSELVEMEAVKPNVPHVTNVSESASKVGDFVARTAGNYPDLDIRADGSSIYISADNTIYFPVFREAIGHVQNGGRGWRVNIEDMCVGRECPQKPLAIKLKVNRVSIETNG